MRHQTLTIIFLLQLFLIRIISAYLFPETQISQVSPQGVSYWEYLPPDYQSSYDTYPLIIFLHGMDERGNGTTDMTKVMRHGPPKHIKNGHDMGFFVNGKKEHFLVISPQTASRSWSMTLVDDFVKYIIDNYKVDKNRVHVTGLSKGGGSTWAVAVSDANEPNKYASAAPVCGWARPSKGCVIADRGIAVWAFHGDTDGTISISSDQNMINAINNCTTPVASPKAKFRIYSGVNHYIWNLAYSVDHSYQNPNMYEWMLMQYKKED